MRHTGEAADAGAPAPPLVLVVTGRAGSGKSALSGLLRDRHGAAVVDADQLGRDAHEDPVIRRRIAERYGPAVLDPRGGVDRAALAQIVFRDRAALEDLNAIVHPWISQRIRDRLAALRGAGNVAIVVVDAALLPLWRGAAPFDRVIWVRCGEETAKRRLRLRGWTEEEALRRLESQPGDEVYRAASDLIIDNEGSLDELAAQSDHIVEELRGGRSRPADG